MRYDGFLSYSQERDADLATALHSALQRFNKPWYYRRPFLRIARDTTSFGASDELDNTIRHALDRSEHFVLLLSPESARSPWVNQEVAHWLATKGPSRMTFVVTRWAGPHPAGQDPEADLDDFRWDGDDVPEAMRAAFREPLAVDLRWARHTGYWARDDPRYRSAVSAIAAGIKQIDKDELVGEIASMRKRARRITSAVVLGLVLLTTAVSVAIPRWFAAEDAADRAEELRAGAEAEAEKISPVVQVHAFEQYFIDELMASAARTDLALRQEEIEIEVITVDNLNGDRLLDFVVFNQTAGWCGSGGCAMEVYLAAGDNGYESVLSLFGHSNPRLRETESQFKSIAATKFSVDSKPVSSVFQWVGSEYKLTHYEYCDGVWFEYCEPTIIEPLAQVNGGISLRPGACLLDGPTTAGEVVDCDTDGSVVGPVIGTDWYLVEIWKGSSGFAHREDILELP